MRSKQYEFTKLCKVHGKNLLLSCIVKKIDVLLHCEKKEKMYNLIQEIWKQLIVSVIRS